MSFPSLHHMNTTVNNISTPSTKIKEWQLCLWSNWRGKGEDVLIFTVLKYYCDRMEEL